MKKNKITGWVGTLVLHALLLLLLWVLVISQPQQQEEGGVPVMLGDVELSQGNADPMTLTEVDVLGGPEASIPEMVELEEVEPEPVPSVEQPLMTQDEEPTVTVPKQEPKVEDKKTVKQPKPVEKPKKQPKKEVKKTPQKTTQPKKSTSPKKPQSEVVKPKEPTEAEKRAEAERRAAAERAAAEKAAAEAAAKRIAGAFGKGTQMGNRGTGQTSSGLQGSPTGNAATGSSAGVGGYGTFDLNGRSLGGSGLPKPVYNVQDEGRVVVTITVNPAGSVIQTSINKRTNTSNPALQKAALDAARKARFNRIDGVNNQAGTITYYFKLK